jgi:hypothetical protein
MHPDIQTCFEVETGLGYLRTNTFLQTRGIFKIKLFALNFKTFKGVFFQIQAFGESKESLGLGAQVFFQIKV